ncbi:MAG TPA: hypothetical protein VJY33_09820 [Isosphaeraceae bacterium]|nr:hypothetical protein [Isosphaeraceae bacterium]
MVVHWCPYSRAKAWQSNCYYTGERLHKELVTDVKAVTSNLNEIYIERPNDERVLDFLFRPEIAGKLKKQKQPASYMLLRLAGKELVGTWNGLFVRTEGTNEVKKKEIIRKDIKFFKINLPE